VASAAHCDLRPVRVAPKSFPIVLAAPSIKGFANWTRFPYWTKEPQDDGGWLVTFRDLRYVDPGQAAQGIGLVQVRLDSALNPID